MSSYSIGLTDGRQDGGKGTFHVRSVSMLTATDARADEGQSARKHVAELPAAPRVD